MRPAPPPPWAPGALRARIDAAVDTLEAAERLMVTGGQAEGAAALGGLIDRLLHFRARVGRPPK